MSERGILLREGTRVDATIIAAAASTKNKAKARDPERHQTRQGQPWYFGMRKPTSAWTRTAGWGIPAPAPRPTWPTWPKPSACCTGRRNAARATRGYTGVEKRAEMVARFPHVEWQVAAKRGRIKAMAEGQRKEVAKALEKSKAPRRAEGEHPFHVVKTLFRHRQVRDRGLAKNTAPLHTLFALANLVIAKPALR